MAESEEIPPVEATSVDEAPAVEPGPEYQEPPVKAPFGSKGRKHNSKHDPTPEKKRKPTFEMKMALLQVIERKQLSERVGYQEIANRCGVNADSLKQLMVLYRRGLVDLGQPETPEEVALDARNQHERTLRLVAKANLLFLDQLEHQLISADRCTKKKQRPVNQMKAIPGIIRNIAAIIALKHKQEEGYSALLNDMLERRRREEKSMGIPAETSTQIIGANDSQKAIHALTGELQAPEDTGEEPPHADPQNEDEEWRNFLNARGA
jgi:hypothetical protein